MNYIIRAKTVKGEVKHNFHTPEDIEWVSISRGEQEIKWFVDGRIEVNGKEVTHD